MNVRLADRVNIPALVKLVVAMHAESPHLRDEGSDPEGIVYALSKMIDAETAVIAQDSDGIAGFMLFAVFKPWWSKALIATDQGLYVRPEHRGRFLAGQLVRRAEVRAAELGAMKFRCGTYAGIATEAVSALYGRAGYADTGRCFQKTLRPEVEGGLCNTVASEGT